MVSTASLLPNITRCRSGRWTLLAGGMSETADVYWRKPGVIVGDSEWQGAQYHRLHQGTDNICRWDEPGRVWAVPATGVLRGLQG